MFFVFLFCGTDLFFPVAFRVIAGKETADGPRPGKMKRGTQTQTQTQTQGCFESSPLAFGSCL